MISNAVFAIMSLMFAKVSFGEADIAAGFGACPSAGFGVELGVAVELLELLLIELPELLLGVADTSGSNSSS